MKKPLRFVPLVRVSTERQSQQGESLRTQRTQIIQFVQNLGGIIPDYCWIYSGQEHATPDFERRKLDQLLHDATKDLFDAVIVTDASRWSRDNRKSKESLEILKDNNISFYCGTTKMHLHNPEQILFLGLSAEICEYQARLQSLKSLNNRVERAKRGIPSAGKLPYGRKFDRATGKWSVDKEAQRKIQYAADQYLNGGQLPKIAKQLNMNTSNLWKIINHCSGTRYTVTFKAAKLNIDETITITIPRLLSDETIAAIHERAQANKTYTHGHIKNQYLLSRVVFCDECGFAMTAQTDSKGCRYYRHRHDEQGKLCNPSVWVPADNLEKAVLVQLFAIFGDTKALEAAIKRAIPNPSRIRELETRLEDINKELAKINVQMERLIDKVADGLLSDEEIVTKRKKIHDQKNLLIERKSKIVSELDSIPNYTQQLKKIQRFNQEGMREQARLQYAKRNARDPYQLSQMDYDSKRHLVEQAFGGRDSNGKRLGVYVRKDGQGIFHYTINGIVNLRLSGSLPMTNNQARGILHDFDFNLDEDLSTETKFAKQLLSNFLDVAR